MRARRFVLGSVLRSAGVSALGPSVILAAALVGTDADGYAFLCNGIDATGEVDGDGCGACSANSAARWDEFQVDFRFDDTVRPSGGNAGTETLGEWQTHQTQTVANWNNVNGQSLFIRDAGAAEFREFGYINGENSVFWITNINEFRDQVGDSGYSTLGVTLAPYNCGSPRREGILDADLVMNGTGSFNWDQTSVVSTMTHEMGHAIGLGHPCVDCVYDSIMSATGGGPDDSEVPLYDDEEGIRALYPGEPGGLGTACVRDSDCDENRCVTVPLGGTNRSFCSVTCNGTCQNGMVCAEVTGEGDVCVFSNAGLADPGDACGPPGCVEECIGSDIGAGCNVCLPVNDAGDSRCFAGCAPADGDQGCDDGETCVGFQCSRNSDCGAGGPCSGGECQNAGVCLSSGGSALRGQACTREEGCVDGVTCITDANGQNGVCLGLCGAQGSGCLLSENCLFLFGDDEQGACLPAGSGREGDSCADFDDCARGLLCLDRKCYQRCDRGFQCSDDEQSCSGLGADAGGMTICMPLAGGGDGGEGEGEGEGDNGGNDDSADRECDSARGNFDCPQGQSCTDNGACVLGEGPTGTFGLCDADNDCSGGLCVNGVCTRPCDVVGGCPRGYTCDAEEIPGGLCRADSCGDDDSLCDATAGFTCTFTSASRYACAKGVAPGCGCSSSASSGAMGPLGLALVALLRRRRRH
jgi:MYXO-CTERM domain-containing protein